MSQTVIDSLQPGPPQAFSEVLTLAEAAAYLRLSEAETAGLVDHQGLPGRRIGGEWRFLKAAIQDWLRVPQRRQFLSTHFGALKGDPYLEQMLREIYPRSG